MGVKQGVKFLRAEGMVDTCTVGRCRIDESERELGPQILWNTVSMTVVWSGGGPTVRTVCALMLSR